MVNSPNAVNKHQNTFIREMLFQDPSLKDPLAFHLLPSSNVGKIWVGGRAVECLEHTVRTLM
jgi:hypothetical protein